MLVWKSHASRWGRRPTWPTLRFVEGQTETLIAVGEPWTFELPPVGHDKCPSVKHLVNVLRRREVDLGSVKACSVWEISDKLYRSINFDPTFVWFEVTRFGTKKTNTHYEITPTGTPDEKALQGIRAKHLIDLELVAMETYSRILRHQISRK